MEDKFKQYSIVEGYFLPFSEDYNIPDTNGKSIADLGSLVQDERA